MSLQEKVVKKVGQYFNKLKANENDFIIVSYPKAGSTWLRFLLANLFNFKTKTYEEVDFHSIHNIIPDLDQPVNHSDFDDLPSIYSTHNPYKSNFKNCILLLRNPEDLLFSYYNYLNGEHHKEMGMEEIVKSPTLGIQALVAHTNSFVKNCDNLIIVTYEMIHEDPIGVMQKLMRFVNLDITDAELSKAIELSSFKSMRSAEDRKGRKFVQSGFKFTRSGKVGEGGENISEELKQYISKEIEKSPVLNLIYN